MGSCTAPTASTARTTATSTHEEKYPYVTLSRSWSPVRSGLAARRLRSIAGRVV
ncbi:MAG TPA: hypothetical protein VE953_18505 [Terriglobales bacterium]|nr:hypothetical protein [Terriglobales bacterium]